MSEPTIIHNVQLRLASINDMVHLEVPGKAARNIGMHYWIKNGSGELECYRLTDQSDSVAIARFIEEGRCYVCQES